MAPGARPRSLPVVEAPLRAAQASSGAAAGLLVHFLYASQTGTGQEIAKTLQAEAESRGIASKACNFNEVGADGVSADKTPVIVFVASSTGDGDPPDTSAKARGVPDGRALGSLRPGDGLLPNHAPPPISAAVLRPDP